MLVTIQCPECRNSARVEDQFLGRSVRCRSCETSFVAKATATVVPAKKPAPTRPPSDSTLPRNRPTRPRDDDDDSRPTRTRSVRRDDIDEEDDEEIEERPRRRKKKKPAPGNGLYIGIGLAVGLVGMGVVLALTLGGNPKPADPAVVEVANRDPGNGVPPAPRAPNPAPAPKAVPEVRMPLPVVPGDNKTEPVLAEADRKLFTVWNVRVRPQGGDLALTFDFRRKNQTDHPALMLILLTETGEKIMIDLNRGGAKTLDDKNGTVLEVIGSGNGGGGMGKMGPGGPGGFGGPGGPGRNRGLPKFAKGSKFWIAAHGAREIGSGPFGSPNDGTPLSNIIEMVVE